MQYLIELYQWGRRRVNFEPKVIFIIYLKESIHHVSLPPLEPPLIYIPKKIQSNKEVGISQITEMDSHSRRRFGRIAFSILLVFSFAVFWRPTP
jgi:hypothetical protein